MVDQVEIVSHLGENTFPIAAVLADHLSDSLGIPVVFDPDAGEDVRLGRIRSGNAAVMWMCGLLTIDLIEAAALDATIVAAPVFRGQHEAVYHSVIVSRPDAVSPDLYGFHGATVAINERGSWSGHHALRAHLVALGMPDPFFRGVIETGSHAASIRAVIDGRAHCAAIDHSVWEYELGHTPPLGRLLRVVDITEDWPAPPFCVSNGLDPALATAIASDLVTAFRDPETAYALRANGLDGLRAADSAAYDPIRRGREMSDLLSW